MQTTHKEYAGQIYGHTAFPEEKVDAGLVEHGQLAGQLVGFCKHALDLCDSWLLSPDFLTPLMIERISAGDQFRRGLLTCVAEMLTLLSKTPEGRQALSDFLLEPVLEDVERPRGGGGND
jgi:hypothetical protein